MDKEETIKAEEGKTSKLAVITFAIGIASIPIIALSFFYINLALLSLILPLISIVLGTVALLNIASSDRKVKGKNLAILGMVLGIGLNIIYWIFLMVTIWPLMSMG